MVNYMGKIEDSGIQLSDKNGETQTVPLVGAFKVDGKYYVVVRAEEDGKEENIMYRVEKRADGTEYIQIITDREEWETAYDAWVQLTYEAMRVENDKKV